jgi:hypothetical protein
MCIYQLLHATPVVPFRSLAQVMRSTACTGNSMSNNVIENGLYIANDVLSHSGKKYGIFNSAVFIFDVNFLYNILLIWLQKKILGKFIYTNLTVYINDRLLVDKI